MKTIYWLLILAFLFGCREKYVAKIDTPGNGNLVVEGFINTADSPSYFSLTRSSSLDSAEIIPETGAAMEVQSSNGTSYPLSETSAGNYSIAGIPVDAAQQYRVHIRTSGGKEYMSDFAAVKATPPIDSVSWSQGSDAITIKVSTHDNQDASRYYSWQYEETWQYQTPFNSEYTLSQTGDIVARDSSQVFPNYCWSSDQSQNIILATTDNLSSDVISNFVLTTVPYTTNKLYTRYSILVKQQALTKDWYEWQLELQKNTEQLGSIFDPQPSETKGNIHCVTDSGELVIGFVGCTSLAEKRIFVNRSDIDHLISSGYESCQEQKLDWPSSSTEGILAAGGGVITDLAYTGMNISSVFISSTACADCRLNGGTGVQPTFW